MGGMFLLVLVVALASRGERHFLIKVKASAGDTLNCIKNRQVSQYVLCEEHCSAGDPTHPAGEG